MNRTLRLSIVLASALLLLVGRSLVLAQTPPPEGMNFSVLSEENPQSELSLTEGYKGALATTWKVVSVNTNSSIQWKVPWQDDHVKLSPPSYPPIRGTYCSYLVTPALLLDQIGGKSLSFELKTNSPKGDSPLKILLIDKEGNTLQELYSHQYDRQDYMPTEVSVPSGLSGVGFIAFVGKGDKNNRCEFLLKNIELKTASTETMITYNPSTGLVFSEVAAGEVGATKEVQVIIRNFTGTPTTALTGTNKEDFILNGTLTSTGGNLSVTFAPKNGNPNITAAIMIQAGDKTVDIPLRASATGSAAAVKVSASPTSLSFGSISVGTSSTQKAVSITIQNAVEKPQITLEGQHQGDFAMMVSESMDNHGGGISVVFTPTGAGERSASIVVNASGTLLSIPLSGVGEAVVPDPIKPEPTENVELLADQFFYEFNESGQPTQWSYQGSVSKLERGYNSSTGFAVTIDQRTASEPGRLWQDIDLDKVAYSMVEGSVLQGSIHYRVNAPFAADKGVRLACQWLDADKQPVVGSEDKFIHNVNYFEWRNSWDEVSFRTLIPSGARYFRFALEVSEGSHVDIDDCSLLRLRQSEASKRFVSVLPHAVRIKGTTSEALSGKYLVQAMNLPDEFAPTIVSPTGKVMLMPAKLPSGNSVSECIYFITDAEAGAYESGASGTKPFEFRYDSEATYARMRINAFITDANNPPSVRLSSATPLRELRSMVGSKEDLDLTFDVKGVIKEVKVTIEPAGGAFKTSTSSFYYSASQHKVLNNQVKVTFAPQEPGEYEATLRLTTEGMEDLVLHITGICEAAPSEWAESFGADRQMDSRFTGERWQGYHLFDRGYYRLDGSFVSAGEVSMAVSGSLEYDELILNGVNIVTLTPSTAQSSAKVYYTLDGGGHWTEAILQGGAYQLGTHRPTRFKVVNTGSSALTLQGINLKPNQPADRLELTTVAQGMILDDSNQPMALLNENFNALRHTRGVNLASWQSFTTRADRPFWGWDQKALGSDQVEETCAQISFFNSLVKEDDRAQEAWLISPKLSYKAAKSKTLTFRLRYTLPTTDGKEQFGVYILTPTGDGGVKTQFLDITKLLLTDFETDIWYDFYADLSAIPEIQIEDTFYVAFTLYSPVGGNKTSLTFMVDDVTFGRSDLPEVQVDKDQLNFTFQPNVNCEPQPLHVTVQHPSQPVVVSLVPKTVSEEFKVSATSLPAAGGDLAVGFSSKQSKDRAGALLLQTRGGKSAMVRLLAQYDNAVVTPDTSIRLHVYPTETTGRLEVSAPYDRYYIFTPSGQLVAEGSYVTTIDVTPLPVGNYFIRLVGVDGGVATQTFTRQ